MSKTDYNIVDRITYTYTAGDVKYFGSISATDNDCILLDYNEPNFVSPTMVINNKENLIELVFELTDMTIIIHQSENGIRISQVVDQKDNLMIIIDKKNIKFINESIGYVTLNKLDDDSSYYKFDKILNDNTKESSLKFKTDLSYDLEYHNYVTWSKISKIENYTYNEKKYFYWYDANKNIGIGIRKSSSKYSFIISYPTEDSTKEFINVNGDHVYYFLDSLKCSFNKKTKNLVFYLGNFTFGLAKDKFGIVLNIHNENKSLKKYNLLDKIYTNFIISKDLSIQMKIRKQKKLILNKDKISMYSTNNECSDIYDEFGISYKAEEELNSLIGLDSIKRSIKRIKAYSIKNKKDKVNLHMSFLGNPGTGKTMVAKLMSDILYFNDILPTNNFFNCTRSDLVGEYIGETATKTKELLEKAIGGVLFVDEAYSLAGSDSDYGKEAIDVLLKFMEDHKGEFCCILAGYDNEMEKLFNMNPGFKSRIQFHLHFDDYNIKELQQILEMHLKKNKLNISDKILPKLVNVIKYKKDNLPNFANGREVRNIVEQLAMIAAERDNYDGEIIEEDINTYMLENTIVLKNIGRYPMFSNPSLQDFYKLNYIPKSFDYNQNKDDVYETIIGISVFYSDDHFIKTGFIFTPNGYAVTCGRSTKTSIKAEAVRHIFDIHNNIVETKHEVKLALDYNKINIVKLNNNDDIFEYLPLNEQITIKDYIDKILLVVGVSLDETGDYIRKPYDTSYIKITNLRENLNFEFKTLEEEIYHMGSAIIDPETCYVVGMVIGDNLAMSIDNLINIIKEK